MSKGTVRDDGRYWAFISYSHKDAAFGRRLHRRLEAYALPRRLVGRAEGIAVPRRLTPIFRDREEFPAAQDLSAEVRAALQESRSLIVVCSPAAAASPWVAREVELFRELHPDRPVFAAIREGDPKDSLPPVLRLVGPDGRALEPLAADFRRGHDGWELGLLKLIAGMLGVGLDELVQRDGQRRMQRVMAVTATAVAAMLVMSVLTAIALSARSEAERQRGEAEGLVEFMLTDLRTTLKGVGRLDVLTAVNARALKYYADQDLDRLPPDSLERRARVLQSMGEDDEKLGHLDRAIADFREASRTTTALLAAAPRDPKRIFAHAQSEYWAAFTDYRRDNYEAAHRGFERYAALAARLLAIDARNPDWQMEAIYAETNLGIVALRGQRDAAAARKHFLNALGHLLLVAKARPADTVIQGTIANTYAWIADSLRAERRYDDAVRYRELERGVLLALIAAHPEDVQNRYDMLGTDLGLARLDMDRGDRAQAGRTLAGALDRARGLFLADPRNKKLAKQVRALELFGVQNRFDAGPDTPADIAAMEGVIDGCKGSDAIQADDEIGAFCRLLKVRLLLRRGARDQANVIWQGLAADRSKWLRLPYSPRWGIDFRQEYASTETNLQN